jgi:hypothetical protein
VPVLQMVSIKFFLVHNCLSAYVFEFMEFDSRLFVDAQAWPGVLVLLLLT